MKSNIKVVPAKSKTVRSLLRTDRKVILFCFVLVAIEFGYTKGIKILCIFFFANNAVAMVNRCGSVENNRNIGKQRLGLRTVLLLFAEAVD